MAVSNSIPSALSNVTGASDLLDWFGYWPSFHDAEILELHLNNVEASVLRVHTWRMTDRVDSSGYFECDKNVVAEFRLCQITKAELYELEGVGVAFGIRFEQTSDGIQVQIDAAYGVSGSITAKQLQIACQPGKPNKSQ